MPHLGLEYLAIGALLGLLYCFVVEPGIERVRAAVCNWRIKRFFATPAPDGCTVRAQFDNWGRVTYFEQVANDELDTADDWWNEP